MVVGAVDLLLLRLSATAGCARAAGSGLEATLAAGRFSAAARARAPVLRVLSALEVGGRVARNDGLVGLVAARAPGRVADLDRAHPRLVRVRARGRRVAKRRSSSRSAAPVLDRLRPRSLETPPLLVRSCVLLGVRRRAPGGPSAAPSCWTVSPAGAARVASRRSRRPPSARARPSPPCGRPCRPTPPGRRPHHGSVAPGAPRARARPGRGAEARRRRGVATSFGGWLGRLRLAVRVRGRGWRTLAHASNARRSSDAAFAAGRDGAVTAGGAAGGARPFCSFAGGASTAGARKARSGAARAPPASAAERPPAARGRARVPSGARIASRA